MSHEITKYAFPGDAREQYGLHMRDWFAGMAMDVAMKAMEDREMPYTPERVAVYAYDLADAMMKARVEK